MKNVLFCLLVCLCANVCIAGEEPDTKQLVTNTWDAAIMLYNQGLQEGYRSGWFVINGCSTNYVSLEVFRFAIAQSSWDQGEHVSDYPKTSTAVLGVQWLCIYTRVVKIDDEERNVTYTKYTYPHKKITITTEVALKSVTTVKTNVVEMIESKETIKTWREKN